MLITLLDRHFAITCADPRYAELIASMWDVPGDASAKSPVIPIDVDVSPSGWRISAPRIKPFSAVNPWLFLATLRSVLDDLALAGDDSPIALHAVGVRKNGIIVLIVGAAGAGKTSLGLTLVDAGWSLVCDDLAPLRDSGELTGIVRPIGIRSSGAAWGAARSLWDPPAWMPEPTGIFFVPAGAVPRGAGGKVSAVFFPEIGGAKEPETAAIDRPLAIARLVSHARNVESKTLRTVAQMCRHASSFDLRYADLDTHTVSFIQEAARAGLPHPAASADAKPLN